MLGYLQSHFPLDSNYSFLIEKLEKFIRKYYLNELLRGTIYFVALLLISLLLVSTVEYFGHLGSLPRVVMFYGFVLGHLTAFSFWIALPILKLAKLGKTISHKQAAKIIGSHFGDVQDKLLNTLELQETSTGSRDLIQASISQKMESLQPVPFNLAVSFTKNKKYVKYAAIPLLLTLALLIQVPDVILKSSARIISYNIEFVPEAPFQFVLQNEDLEVLHHDDIEIKIKVEGQELPAAVRLSIDGSDFRMLKSSSQEFSYVLRNVDRSKEFRFTAAGFNSKTYELNVLPKPFLRSFQAVLKYPSYLGKKDENKNNIGDFTVPEGTIIEWKFDTENADDIKFNWEGALMKGERLSKNSFRYTRQVLTSGQYFVQSTNQFVPRNDSMGYGVQVVKDAYPSVLVQMVSDTTSLKSYFFSGELSDDYGLTQLKFYYRFTKSEDKSKLKSDYLSVNVPISSKSLQSFFHHWDLKKIGYDAGDELEFYFQVWDNDGINGRKSSKSKKLSIKAPSKSEMQEMVSESSSMIKDDLQEAVKEAAKVQKELKDVQNRLMNKQKLDWEDKQMINKLLEREQALSNNIEKLNEKYKKMVKEQDEFNKMDEAVREKHEKLMELFDQLMDEEMKELFEELQKLMEENSDQLDENLEDMELNNEELEKELDAALEHFKQLEMEQKMEETIEKLEELAEEQKELAEKTEKEEGSKEDLAKEQEELNKKFEEIKEDLDKVEEMNDELEDPQKIESTEEKEEEIEEEMEKGTEELKKGKNKKASEKQKDAAEKMEEMKEQIQANMESMEMESMELDYEALRQIMENLIYLSFEQEKLIDELGEIHSYNPKYVDLAQRQMKLSSDAKMIEDSLISLSKSVMQISGFITKEVGEMNFHLEKTIDNLGERQIQDSRKHQQFVMTHVNNLAVMLSEVMQQMQQQMSQKMDGKQNCQNPSNKPGKKKGEGMKKKLGSMREMQEQLNKQIGEMKGKMDKGGRPLSKDLAKTAAQQEALRKQLQALQEMKESGGEPSNELKDIQEMMDKTEEDIVNQRITSETLKRQQEIVNQLLESEKAEREQEWDSQRESKTADQIVDPSQKAFEEYRRERMKEIELLNSVPPQLNNYYKQKVKAYFQEID